MIVLKFGGTSVGNAQAIKAALRIIQAVLDQSPLVVSSAMTKVTDDLVQVVTKLCQNQAAEAASLIDRLWRRHQATAQELLGSEADDCLTQLAQIYQELASIVRGLCLIRQVSDRSRDRLLSFGEQLSTILLYHYAKQQGLPAVLFDARLAIKTDDRFTAATVLWPETEAAITALLRPVPGQVIITQGFIASTMTGVTTTLGRGGSDYSATLFGAALQAQAVEIWTDVNGIMTTDPRLVAEARVIDQISYDEAAELAYFGAKVIHPATIQPAVERNIPVWVKNTFNPEATGTRIDNSAAVKGLRAIAGKKNISVVTVRSLRMLHAHGFLRSMFQVFEDLAISVDLIATSEVSVSVTIEDSSLLTELSLRLSKFAEVEIEKDQAIISLIGRDLWKDSAFVGRAFGALNGIPLRLISLGSSDINLSLVVAQQHLTAAINRLHTELI